MTQQLPDGSIIDGDTHRMPGFSEHPAMIAHRVGACIGCGNGNAAAAGLDRIDRDWLLPADERDAIAAAVDTSEFNAQSYDAASRERPSVDEQIADMSPEVFEVLTRQSQVLARGSWDNGQKALATAVIARLEADMLNAARREAEYTMEGAKAAASHEHDRAVTLEWAISVVREEAGRP